ncbi:MAG TPA: periplasmic heavy metal sensor [Candidatus Binatia bacterium]|jgi:hypothetical protein|nr:periplasmic heavy metal sensor [Candidatus Binatia bacterium]
MKKGLLILVLGLVVATAGFASFYYLGTTSCRGMMQQPKPELAWLKQQFHLSDQEFARVSQLHDAYLPQCAARCQRIQEENAKLRDLFTQATDLTPEIQNLLAERAKMRADCEAEMMKHFLAVSRTMPPEQGRRYLAWVEQQTFLRGHEMENHHLMDAEGHMAGHHHM